MFQNVVFDENEARVGCCGDFSFSTAPGNKNPPLEGEDEVLVWRLGSELGSVVPPTAAAR